MTRNFRRLGIGALAIASVLGTSACGTQTRPGAAAIVGDSSISTDRLLGLVTRGLADPAAAQRLGNDKAAYQRQQLARLITHDVLQEAARDTKVSVSEGQVDQRLRQLAEQLGGQEALEQQAAQNGIAVADLRSFVRDLALTDAIGDKLVEGETVDSQTLANLYQQQIGQYDQVHTAHILLKDKPAADDVLNQVRADPSKFAALAAQLSTDTSNKDNGGDLGFAGQGQFVKPFEDAVFAAKPGDIIEVQTQFGFHVVQILERRTTSIEQATPQLRRQALKSQRDERLATLLQRTAKKLGVKVNPRFGRWQASTGEVVPVEDTVSRPAQEGGTDVRNGNAPNPRQQPDPQRSEQPQPDQQQPPSPAGG